MTGMVLVAVVGAILMTISIVWDLVKQEKYQFDRISEVMFFLGLFLVFGTTIFVIFWRNK